MLPPPSTPPTPSPRFVASSCPLLPLHHDCAAQARHGYGGQLPASGDACRCGCGGWAPGRDDGHRCGCGGRDEQNPFILFTNKSLVLQLLSGSTSALCMFAKLIMYIYASYKLVSLWLGKHIPNYYLHAANAYNYCEC